MLHKVVIELHIDPAVYDDPEMELEEMVCVELIDLMRSDILSACEVEEINE